MSTYEDLMRAMLWPNAVASASLVPHAGQPPIQTLGTICEGPGGFRVSLDVHQFGPREISVKTVGNTVTIEGRHEERPDEHGYVSRHFVRRYVLPDDYDVDHVACSLSSDGVLSIAAPKTEVHESGVKTKTVPIVMHNIPAVKPHPEVHHFDTVKSEVPSHSAKPASHHGLN
ncbi:heat shock protein 26-like [Neocloeon triangulifer]|uniref:heat shock protein 26-like n=1 Tax=Neocloeon triangulifer TaxID=2078957 RepID=UPI00286F017D|nr:heat shock protein 26-like [Neocloeon triangulifer]XP_059479755.1 heat shock protein 26-like [Neocloeon triangulifer]